MASNGERFSAGQRLAIQRDLKTRYPRIDDDELSQRCALKLELPTVSAGLGRDSDDTFLGYIAERYAWTVRATKALCGWRTLTELYVEALAATNPDSVVPEIVESDYGLKLVQTGGGDHPAHSLINSTLAYHGGYAVRLARESDRMCADHLAEDLLGIQEVIFFVCEPHRGGAEVRIGYTPGQYLLEEMPTEFARGVALELGVSTLRRLGSFSFALDSPVSWIDDWHSLARSGAFSVDTPLPRSLAW